MPSEVQILLHPPMSACLSGQKGQPAKLETSQVQILSPTPNKTSACSSEEEHLTSNQGLAQVRLLSGGPKNHIRKRGGADERDGLYGPLRVIIFDPQRV